MSYDVPHPDQAPSLSRLFLSFLKLGLTAFGGPAMVAFIRKMAVNDKHWLDEDTFKRGVALCQTVPGATAMQTCAYVGLELRGVRGATASFIGFGLPAFVLMLGLSALYERFHTLPAFVSVFGGLRVVIVAVVANAAITFGRSNLKRWRDAVIVAFAAIAFWFGLSPILVVAAAALLGILLSIRDKAVPGTPKAGQVRSHLLPAAILALSTILALGLLIVFDQGLSQLSLLMMKVDVFAFGGGLASVPLMLHEVVDIRHWLGQQVFMDGIALGQITPGPIVITSTFVGYLTRGIGGAVVATLSIFLPSFLVVIVAAPYFARLNAVPLFRKAINGILCSFVGLLVCTALRMGFAVPWTIPYAILCAAALAALVLRVDLPWVILAGGLLSFMIR